MPRVMPGQAYGRYVDLAATRRLARNPQMRWLMAAWTAFYVGMYAYFVLAVAFTYSAGGARVVGAVTVLTVLPGGLVGPLTASLATSRRPQVHLALGIAARIVVMAATIAAVLNGAPLAAVLVLVGTDSLVSSAVRPLHGALVVRLAETAAEAAAANAATSSLVSAGALAGPALAGAALRLVGIGWAFTLPAVACALGAGAALLIRVPRPREGLEQTQGGARQPRASAFAHFTKVGTGFRAILASPPATAATALFVVNMTLLGVWYVASASVANDRLRLGAGGVTTIMTLFGAGGLAGALATLSIVGRPRLARVLAFAMIALAVTVAAIGTVSVAAAGFALAAGVGAAGAVAYAIAPTLVQRSVSREAMVPAAAGLQSLYLVGIALGATLTPALIESVGVPTGLVCLGGAVVVITAVAWIQLRFADSLSADDAAKLAIIAATPSLAPLPALALEQLARAATRVTVPAGSDVIRQGDAGDRFYMIAAGIADVTIDGRQMATLGPGGSFGEIALMEDVPRSATVTARQELELIAVDRAEFLGALSGGAGVARLGGVARIRLATTPLEERLRELDRDTALAGRSAAELLAAQPQLAGTDSAAVRALAVSSRVLAAPDGAILAREGDYGDAYYVILDGAAEVVENDTTVRRLGPGQSFGEHAIMSDVPQPATVRAVGATRLLTVGREAFRRAQAAQ